MFRSKYCLLHVNNVHIMQIYILLFSINYLFTKTFIIILAIKEHMNQLKVLSMALSH